MELTFVVGMANNPLTSTVDGDSGSSAAGGRPDFVEFRGRLQRLVQALFALRDLPPPDRPWSADPERVEVKLESDAVTVQFVVTQLPWEAASDLIHKFRLSFARLAPVFLETQGRSTFTLAKPLETKGGYERCYASGNTVLTFDKNLMSQGYTIKVETNLNDFNAHFEVFTTDAARTLFPPIEKPRKQKAADLESWHKEVGRAFERAGCRVLREASLGWTDLVGLDDLRNHLKRSIFQPLAREALYQKIAQRVIPHRVNVLPAVCCSTGHRVAARPGA